MKLILFCPLFLLIGCKSYDSIKNEEFHAQNIPGPRLIVYKTKKDYNNLVPVILSNDKTEIISYPHPNDLTVGNGFSIPTVLDDKYLLDNRGINENVAFLKLTYQEYSELKSVPTLKELFDNILDKNPLTELCDCGNKYDFLEPVSQLNSIISKNNVEKICKKIK